MKKYQLNRSKGGGGEEIDQKIVMRLSFKKLNRRRRS
jgi:hypothetical protein